MEVESEINVSFESDKTIKPEIDAKHVISKFRVKFPRKIEEALKDNDGDYIVPRKTTDDEKIFFLEHSVSTRLELVALQVWRGALLLSDFLIHNRDELAGKCVLELGAGVGLSSLVAAEYADHIFCTDLDSGEILPLLRQNIKRNKKSVPGQITVMGLDWFNLNWPKDLQTAIEKSEIILAADVIYDNDVTEAFIKTITKILSSPKKKILYLALEKRYVFTISDLDSVAPCYEHLLRCLREASTREPWSLWTMTPIAIDFPQRLFYERLEQLTLWKISN